MSVNDSINAIYFNFMTHIFLEGPLPSCPVREALVNGANRIPNAQITVSSMYDGNHGPQHSRLNSTSGAGCWLCSTTEKLATPPNMYLQVRSHNTVLLQDVFKTSPLILLLSDGNCQAFVFVIKLTLLFSRNPLILDDTLFAKHMVAYFKPLHCSCTHYVYFFIINRYQKNKYKSYKSICFSMFVKMIDITNLIVNCEILNLEHVRK